MSFLFGVVEGSFFPLSPAGGGSAAAAAADVDFRLGVDDLDAPPARPPSGTDNGSDMDMDMSDCDMSDCDMSDCDCDCDCDCDRDRDGEGGGACCCC